MKAAPLRADEAEYMVTILSTVAASVSAIDETTHPRSRASGAGEPSGTAAERACPATQAD